MENTVCPNCLKPIKQNINYCNYCGNKITVEDKSDDFPQKQDSEIKKGVPTIEEKITNRKHKQKPFIIILSIIIAIQFVFIIFLKIYFKNKINLVNIREQAVSSGFESLSKNYNELENEFKLFKKNNSQYPIEKSEFSTEKKLPDIIFSATKMNVFYRGVDNPVSFSVSGKTNAKLLPEITHGKLSRTDTGWVVDDLPPEANETTIRIFADDGGGKKFMGEQRYRVKPLPNPIAKVIGEDDGYISIKKLITNPFLDCALPEWVDFQYDFKVTSFTMFIPQGGGFFIAEIAESQMFTEKMKSQIQSLKKNDVIIFRDIKVKGPEVPRKIEPINITIR